MAWYERFLPGQRRQRASPEPSDERLVQADFGFVKSETGDVEVVNFSAPGDFEPDVLERLYRNSVPNMQVNLDDVVENGLEEGGMERDDWLAEFWKMKDDYAVRDALNYIFSYIRSSRYYVEPATEDNENLEQAAFIADSLGLDSMRAGKYPFRRIIKSYELALVYGAAAGEIVLAEGDDNLAIMDKFIPIHPFAIDEIKRDAKGGPKSIQLRGTVLGDSGKTVDKAIAFYKTVYFVNDDEGDMRGESILKSAWLSWKIKKAMLQLVNAGFERFLLGIPVLMVPKTVAKGSRDWADAKATLTKFAMKPRTGMMLPEGYEFSIQVVNSQMPDAIPYIKMQDEAIYRSMGIGFATMGKGDNTSGTYTVGESLSRAAQVYVQMLQQQFLDYLNLYLIPKLVLINWPDAQRFPVLKVSMQNRADASSVLNAFAQMVSASLSEGGFDEARFNSIKEAAPGSVRELLGLDEDKRKELVDSRRRSVR